MDLETIAAEARACRVCEAHLPLGPRPIFQVSARAKVLIASQAPGTKAHVSGTPFNDPSGVRLRAWLAIGSDIFYDPDRVAILPVGLCYPGRLARGGDAPPRPECAPLWHPRLLPLLTDLRLILLIGSYSQIRVLGPGKMSERVRNFRDFLPRYFPLPHPSWRTGEWERQNPWFPEEVLPELRRLVTELVG